MSWEQIVGAFIAGVIGIFVVLFTKWWDELRAKKFTYSILKLEIDANQSQLSSHIKNSNEYWKKSEKDKSDGNKSGFEIVDSLFDRTMYSAVADKISLLDPKIGEMVVQYYTKIKYVEDEVSECNKVYPTRTEGQIKKLRQDALERSIENAEEADEIYKKLIKEPEWQ